MQKYEKTLVIVAFVFSFFIFTLFYSEDTFYIPVGLLGHLVVAHAVAGGQAAHHVGHIGTLVALSAMGDGRHIGAVGLEDDAAERYDGGEVIAEMAALEGEYSTNAQAEPLEAEELLGFVLVAGKAVEYAAHQFLLILAQ